MTFASWIDENNRLYLASPKERPLGTLVAAAEQLMLEWDYGCSPFTEENIYPLADVIWVAPEVIEEERWPNHRVSESERLGWIEVWTYKLDEILTGGI